MEFILKKKVINGQAVLVAVTTNRTNEYSCNNSNNRGKKNECSN